MIILKFQKLFETKGHNSVISSWGPFPSFCLYLCLFKFVCSSPFLLCLVFPIYLFTSATINLLSVIVQFAFILYNFILTWLTFNNIKQRENPQYKTLHTSIRYNIMIKRTFTRIFIYRIKRSIFNVNNILWHNVIK